MRTAAHITHTLCAFVPPPQLRLVCGLMLLLLLLLLTTITQPQLFHSNNHSNNNDAFLTGVRVCAAVQ